MNILRILDRALSGFSEDIDVSIEKEFLGFDDDKNPLKLSSRSKQKALLDELSVACSKYIQEKLLWDLSKAIEVKIKISAGWKLTLDHIDSQTILFSYPTKSSWGEYISPVVKIEMGARAEHWPVSECKNSKLCEGSPKKKNERNRSAGSHPRCRMNLVEVVMSGDRIRDTLVAIGVSPRLPPIAPAKLPGLFGEGEFADTDSGWSNDGDSASEATLW